MATGMILSVSWGTREDEAEKARIESEKLIEESERLKEESKKLKEEGENLKRTEFEVNV
jgi:hypothetical protein